MSADRQEAAKAEVQKLLKAGVIQEIDHPEWLANPVLVRKSNGKWRMCVDSTDLNKACPKDNFPLPRIDQLVDSTAGCELMSFLDAFSGYHQIHMNPADIPKTVFITPFGTFCHLWMPFSLRNAGATFARLVYKVLYKQLGRNVKAYVNDIVVKSGKAFDHTSDLQEIFNNLRAVGMKLNPEKCVFSVRVGKLLGFLVSERGIEANPEKIDAIQQMKPPSSIREVQKLAGRIAALSRFLSKAAERGLSFFKTLQGAGRAKFGAQQKKNSYPHK
jgi:Reverse transcriptase (RNA-dependent DNA polymerase).